MKPSSLSHFYIISVSICLLVSACGKPALTAIANPAEAVSAATDTPSPVPSATVTDTPAPMSDFMKGVGYYTFSSVGYGRPESDYTLTNLVKPMGATWISITPICYQDTINSTEIRCDEKDGTPTDESIRHVIATAKSLGLRVMFKPHVDNLDPNHWRGEISMNSAKDWESWFTNYSLIITRYAAIAAETGADYFVVGTELNATQSHETEWRSLISEVRAIYAGPLTYASNHDGGEIGVNWWDALDAIGVDAYYPLTNRKDPSVAQLKTAWKPYVSLLETLSKKWDRPVIFTEVGYQSTDGANQTPWGVSYDSNIDMQEQANCIQALIETFSPKEWWIGVFWYSWMVEPKDGGPVNQDFVINGKPAENIVRAFYGVSPRTASTPIPNWTVDENKTLPVYSDGLAKDWEDWSWATSLDLASTENSFTGGQSIKASFSSWSAIAFYHPPLDTSPYDFLEFYIYIVDVQNGKYPHITASFNDENETPMFYRPDISTPEYVQDGQLTMGAWHRIRIPLAELGARNIKVTMLTFGHESGDSQVNFYLDDIRLVGAQP
jgi:hypothetical protein